jgi:hypothetical protein
MQPDLNQPDVISEVLAGDGLSLAQAARVVPAFRAGRPTHVATIWRWAAKGVRIGGGRVVKLETCRVGGRQLTSRAALSRFILAQSATNSAESTLPVQKTPAQKNRLARIAKDKLDKLGM